jgi:hypothetical protein
VAVAIIQGLPPVGDIVKVAVALWVFVPLVPVTATVTVSDGAVADVVIVSVAVAEPPAGGVTEDGLIDPVAPAPGGIDTVSVTGELNEFIELADIVKAVDEPFLTVDDVGEIANEKSCISVMTKVTSTL